ncbi:27662_t:CDS:2, partial [Racocetra persica]
MSAGKKALMSSDKKNTALIKNKKTYNDQNKIDKSHNLVESLNYNDINDFNKPSQSRDFLSRCSRSRSLSSQSRNFLSRCSHSHSCRVRRPRLNIHKQAKLANNLSINNNLKNNEDVLINNNFEDSNKDGNFKDLPINNDSFEYNNIDGSLEDISSDNSSDDLED